ncbi:MAG: histidine kinase [Candidatus Omnitrophica bacterium]|nr:histidine kinase [Candidatus Omnitrophota bacterium]
MNNKIINFKEKKLLLAFGFLISLTLVIGLVGISQIQGLTRKIEVLGKNNLSLESAVLEMRIKNANYAMGIRNYVYWRLSRYLGAVPMAVGANKILSAGESFKQQLKLYRQNAYLNQQKEWASQAQLAFDELFVLGKKIIQQVDQEESGKVSEVVNGLLMSFENRIYKIDEFLDNSMGKSNLEEARRQMVLARADKERAIFFLKISLAMALIVGSLIALAVYRRRIKERIYRQDMFNQMINVEEDERKRLSNAVHDEMGQDLSALKIYLGVIQQGLANLPLEAQDKINQCKKIITGLIEKSLNIAFLLRPPDLDEVGLVDSLEALLLECKHLTGVEYNYQKPGVFFELSAEYSLFFYRVTQELLTNMAKHSGAKHVELKLAQKSSSAELSYTDDGRGFDYNAVTKHHFRRREDKLRHGLLGLKERVELLDGQMQINSSAGKGTSIMVALPI